MAKASRIRHPVKTGLITYQNPNAFTLAVPIVAIRAVAPPGGCSTVILNQAAQALRDDELLELSNKISATTKRQLSWLQTRLKQAAPQALIAAE